MQKIAAEIGLSETAFLTKCNGKLNLRWFTPTFEIDLCGHATLATAFVVSNLLQIGTKSVEFETKSGEICVSKSENGFEMLLSKRVPVHINLTQSERENVNIKDCEFYSSRDLICVLKDEKAVRDYVPDYKKLSKITRFLGIVITARGENYDFVSRYFCPEIESEDPVTGSSHSSLVPLWAEKLNKNLMLAAQLSERGGLLSCELCENCVKVSGEAVLFSKGEILI